MPSSRNVLVVAGESSGDLHASHLVRELQALLPDLSFWGIGGENLREAGVDTLFDAASMQVIGFVEVVRRYRYFRSVFETIKKSAIERRPVCAILVDYPGFNIRLARQLHRANIPVVYYIAPQAWAWKAGRTRFLKESVDELIVIFPFEIEFFRTHGIEARFFGNPLVDDHAIGSTRPALSTTSHKGTIAYLPGSRKEEIRRHMPLIQEVIAELGDRYRHVIPLANTITPEYLDRFQSEPRFEILDNSAEAFRIADAALVKSGTSTMEAMMYGVPFAVFYKTSAISYAIAKRLITIDSIAMVNILASETVVQEFVQSDMSRENLVEELKRLLEEHDYRQQIKSGLDAARAMLGDRGTSKRIARFIADKYMGE